MQLVMHLTCKEPGLLDAEYRRIEINGDFRVGRGGDNDLVLADPDRHLSKNHCVIQYDGTGYTITDTSTNGVFLNGSAERLARDLPARLVEGCVIRLGSYELQVIVIAPSAQSAPMTGSAPELGGRRDDGLIDEGLIDDGLFGDPFAAPPTGGMDVGPGIFGPARHSDPFGFEAPAPLAASPSLSRASADDPFGFGGQPEAASPFLPAIPDDIDLFGEPIGGGPSPFAGLGRVQDDHVPSDQMAFIPPKARAEAIPDEWDLSDLGVAFDPALAKAPPPSDFAFEAPATPAAQRQPPPPSLAFAAPTPGNDGAVRAFLAGAGLPAAAISPADSERLMRAAGELLRVAAQGVMEILAARANTKQEFRIERTVIGAARNNPLKMSESPDEALRILLQGEVPGFLTGRRALDEALTDIKTHQLAVLAGMQEALATVVARFDPAKLEKRLEQSSVLDSILPAARKARYWELFKALYREIATELEDDFQKTFGTEFARAYRAQADRL